MTLSRDSDYNQRWIFQRNSVSHSSDKELRKSPWRATGKQLRASSPKKPSKAKASSLIHWTVIRPQWANIIQRMQRDMLVTSVTHFCCIPLFDTGSLVSHAGLWGQLWTSDPSASASKVLILQTCAAMHSQNKYFILKIKKQGAFRDASVVKSTYCSFWGPEFNS